MDVDYAAIYAKVNQLRTVATTQCSEVMAIQRLYVRLNDLDVKGLKEVGVVKQLLVLADVVEVEGELELPGSSQVTIVCRLLKTSTGAVIRLSSLTPVQCHPRRGVSPHVAPGGLSSDGHIVTILATQLVAPPSTRLLVQCPVELLELGSTEAYLGDMDWSSLPFGGASGNTAAIARSCRVTLRESRYTYGTEEQLWQPSFKVMLPQTLPPQLLATPTVLLGIETNTLTCELITEYQREAVQTTAAAHQHTTWLNDQLVAGKNHKTQQIRNLHFRVQALLKLQSADAPLVVPRLQYDEYDELINRMTHAAESYDKEFKQFNLFMQQNEILGSFLVEQNKAFAEKERDMEAHHSQLIHLQSRELELTSEKMDNLTSQLTQQDKAMRQAQADLEAGIKAYRDRQIALAVFASLIAIVKLCFAIFTGGATAGAAVQTAAQLSETAKALQSVIKLLKRLEKVVIVLYAIIDFLTEMQSLEQILDAPEMPELPTDAEWSIFENEIMSTAESMPTALSEVPVWKAKCKNVAALGREIITTAAYLQKLKYELAVNGMLQEIAQQQAERLESLQIKDVDNYLEMATDLDMRTSRMLLGLLKVLSLQTGALSYHYLLPPRPLTGWVSMDTVWNALVKNAYDAVVALSSLDPSVDFEVSYPVKGIPVSLLVEGLDWVFDISIDDLAFMPSLWSRVRIEYVEIKFAPLGDDAGVNVHLPTTMGGKIYILLQAGRFFDDRLKDKIFHYQAAVPLTYQYAYDLASGETTSGNRPDSRYMRMTPFTRWRLRLSASAPENQGLAFPTATTEDATTNITIAFYLTAIRGVSYFSSDDGVQV